MVDSLDNSQPDAQRFVLGVEARPERIDKVLARLLAGPSRATIQRWIDEGRVQLNGSPCRSRDTARAGHVIDVVPGPAPASAAEPDAGVLFQVLYDDAHLIVVNKPAGLVVHPARGHAAGTLVNGLLARPDFQAQNVDERDPTGSLRPGIVHRIDKDTSGILVVAKDAVTREGLKTQLQAHSMERQYAALTLGVPALSSIRSFYGRDPKSRLRFTSLVSSGKRAVTHLKVVEKLAAGRAALLHCRLETGRTHQIRVHLREQAKTPLLADALYGRTPQDPVLARISAELGRQALHAMSLGFVHPVSGVHLRFDAELPQDFQRALAELRSLT